MKKVTLFAAAAAVSALIATPVLAQGTAQPRAGKHMKTSQMKQHASKPMKQQARAGRTSNRVAYQDRRDQRDTGFWPGAVVAGAVGTAGAVAATAVGTAGAIATAPFGGPYYRDSYAYGPGYVDTYSYNGIAMPYSSNYSARNGFMCEPGTFIKGTRNICQ
ncbi:MAG: hypothetical protein Q7V17_21470 [Afipia sp.]|nr:hypothetical protein [Afipia sp.]